MKWRILLNLPSYPVNKQSKIIVACMALHNFIRDSAVHDVHFEEDFQEDDGNSTQPSTDGGGGALGDDIDMGALRDAIAVAMVS